LVGRKIEGQYRTLRAHPDLPGQAPALATFEDWRQWFTMEHPPAWQYDTEYLRALEGRLALSYFRAWERWPLTWSMPDTRRVPPYWLAARSRLSPLAPQRNARHAVDPLNACINYGYAVLASACRQALLAEGFDPVAAFLHSDKPGRDSLTYDLMELERASVDDRVLSFLSRTVLHYGDFARSAEGQVTLHPQLTRLLLAECRVPQSRVDGHARWLRRLLLTGSSSEDSADDRRDDAPAAAPNE
jgi:CRISPR-associated endonuclease Cas1